MRKLMALALILPGAALAQVPDDTWHVWAGSSNPTGNWVGNVLDLTTIIEADSAVGVGFDYELRMSRQMGLAVGISATEYDLDLSVPGFGSAAFGSATVVPFTLTANFHFGDRVDFHLGPTLAYTLWDDLNTNSLFGNIAVDDEFTYGFDLGLDVPIGDDGWLFFFGASYLRTEIADASLGIDVDPTTLKIGFGKGR